MSTIVKDVVKETLVILREYYPEDMKKLDADPAKEKVVVQDATKVAEGEVHHQTTFSFLTKQQESKDVFDLVSKNFAEHLPSSQIDMIIKGLEIPTYQLSFRKESARYLVDFSKKSGEKCMDTIELSSLANLATVDGLQIASIVVEVIGLLLSIVGIVVPEEVMAKVAQKFATVIMESSAVKAAVEAIKKVFSSGGSGTSRATAIWNLIKALWQYKAHSIFMEIVKALCNNMSWFDWLKTAAMITALILAAVATEGVALIAKIVIALNSAYEFTKKVTNLNQLEEIKKTL